MLLSYIKSVLFLILSCIIYNLLFWSFNSDVIAMNQNIVKFQQCIIAASILKHILSKTRISLCSKSIECNTVQTNQRQWSKGQKSHQWMKYLLSYSATVLGSPWQRTKLRFIFFKHAILSLTPIQFAINQCKRYLGIKKYVDRYHSCQEHVNDGSQMQIKVLSNPTWRISEERPQHPFGF